MTSFQNLPNDIELEFLSDLSTRDLVNFCKRNTHAANLCRNPRLWQLKLMKEFPNEYSAEPDPASEYRYLYREKEEKLIPMKLEALSYHELLELAKMIDVHYKINHFSPYSKQMLIEFITNDLYPETIYWYINIIKSRYSLLRLKCPM